MRVAVGRLAEVLQDGGRAQEGSGGSDQKTAEQRGPNKCAVSNAGEALSAGSALLASGGSPAEASRAGMASSRTRWMACIWLVRYSPAGEQVGGGCCSASHKAGMASWQPAWRRCRTRHVARAAPTAAGEVQVVLAPHPGLHLPGIQLIDAAVVAVPREPAAGMRRDSARGDGAAGAVQSGMAGKRAQVGCGEAQVRIMMLRILSVEACNVMQGP